MVPRKQLQESIEHIQEELASGDPLSPEDRARLGRVLDEVSAVLESDEESPSVADDFWDDLREIGDRFETTHPTLAMVIGRIANSLSQLGI